MDNHAIYVTANAAAKRLNMDARAVCRAIKRGAIPAIRILMADGRWVLAVNESDVAAYQPRGFRAKGRPVKAVP